MPRPKSPSRVKGPYSERGGTRFRLRIVENSSKKDLYFSSEEEALAIMADLQRELGSLTQRQLGEVIDEYCSEKELLGRAKAQTCSDQRERLRFFLRDHLEQDLKALTPLSAVALYKSAVQEPTPKTGRPMAAASHRFYLSLAKTFFAWAERKKYVAVNPFKEVQPVGRVSTGKPQLRIDEAQQFVTVGLRLFDEEQDLLALGSVMALLMGLRASEVLLRQVRDIDRGATILWIDGGKTRNARRYLDVPAVLQPRLRKLTIDRAGDELLLGQSRDGVRRDRRSLWVAVGRICRTAGVPRVCPHSLRGLWATLGVQSGAVSHAVAASLGHGSFEMTAKHYAQPEVVSGACTARMIDMLELNPGNDALVQLPAEELLVRLPQETLVKLVDLAYRTGRLLAPKDAAAEALSQSLRVESLRPRPAEKN
jgi:integrase